ncbi:MAG: DUF992 domain-containing protein [Pseudomonadota bacterium]
MKHKLLCLILACLATIQTVAAATAQESVELGLLECFVDAGSGFIFGSTKDISCVFTPARSENPEDNYIGEINKYGLDIGSTEQSYMSWLVIAPSAVGVAPGFLAGNYVGATASATFAVGLGANALVGGSGKSFALQPLSIETQTGLNLAAGIAEIELQPVE